MPEQSTELRQLEHNGFFKGLSVNERVPDHYSVPQQRNPNVEISQYLISRNADVNVKDHHGRSPLHYAAERNSNVEVLRYLISVRDMSVNTQNNEGRTTLDVTNTEEKRAIL